MGKPASAKRRSRREAPSYEEGLADLVSAVLGESGSSPAGTRRAALEFAERLSVSDEMPSLLPPAVGSFVAKVARDPHSVGNDDFEALRRSGLSEEEVFEIIAATSVGTGLRRWNAGMGALRGERS